MKKAEPLAYLIAIVVCAAAVNFLFYKISGKPYLYCWMSDSIGEFYTAVQALVVIFGLAIFAAGFFTKGVFYWLTGGFIIVAALELPELVNMFFALGDGCA